MLPTHGKHHGHGTYQSQSMVATRLPLVLSLFLAAYVIYQRFCYQTLLQEAEVKYFQQEKELAVVRENLFTAKDEIETHKKQHYQEKQTSKALESHVQELVKKESVIVHENEELKRNLRSLQSKAKDNLTNISTELKALQAKCNYDIDALKYNMSKCSSNLKISSTNGVKLEADLQSCINKLNQGNNVGGQQPIPQLNKEQPIEQPAVLPEVVPNIQVEKAQESEIKIAVKQSEQPINNELPANEKLIHVRPEDEPLDPKPAHPVDNELMNRKVAAEMEDTKDDTHNEIVDKVKGFLKQNQQ